MYICRSLHILYVFDQRSMNVFDIFKHTRDDSVEEHFF